jgi:cobalamin-dependent methionine synthase I
MYQEATKKVTTKRPANDQQVTTNNNDNNENNEEVVVHDYDNDSFFMEFWDAYKRKNCIEDTYAYWLTMNVDEELKNQIVHGAKEYSKATEEKRMVFPRTFLINKRWTNYPYTPTKQLSKERLEKLRSMGVKI